MYSSHKGYIKHTSYSLSKIDDKRRFYSHILYHVEWCIEIASNCLASASLETFCSKHPELCPLLLLLAILKGGYGGARSKCSIRQMCSKYGKFHNSKRCNLCISDNINFEHMSVSKFDINDLTDIKQDFLSHSPRIQFLKPFWWPINRVGENKQTSYSKC